MSETQRSGGGRVGGGGKRVKKWRKGEKRMELKIMMEWRGSGG